MTTLVLFELMKKHDIKKFVFSSSATVYGDSKVMPVKEKFPLSATNPYGRRKLMIEDMLRYLYISDSSFNIAILR